MRGALQQAKRIVVKVGSSTLTYPSGHLNLHRMEALVKEISDLANQGKEMILVSSGAVGAGLAPLGFDKKPTDMILKQAAAAVGQGVLLHMYEKLFREYGRTVGQVLLTREDSVSHRHYLNLRNTLMALLNLSVIPIINENDVVAIDEFKIGDNDQLSAHVASIVEADLLIILSDIDGLYTANPQKDRTATIIETVETITPHLYDIAGGAGSGLGTGGMYTKIQAAHIATNSGIHMVIASGEREENIRDIVLGKPVGTHFLPIDTHPHTRKRWMAFGARLKGSITIDEGCAKAVLDKGSSILPAGIISTTGTFSEGETVSIYHKDREIARGIVNYSCHDINAIKGAQTKMIPQLLQVNTVYDEVIHRDNLVILR